MITNLDRKLDQDKPVRDVLVDRENKTFALADETAFTVLEVPLEIHPAMLRHLRI
jgi:hypothetical protein